MAVIDEDGCIVCGVCADERCPMEAIAEGDDAYEVKQGMCIGCGVCVLECPTDAISMVPRPEEERNEPAKNLLDWSVQRRKNQIGPIRAMAQIGRLSLSAARARKDTRE